jgi:hypothetical protein
VEPYYIHKQEAFATGLLVDISSYAITLGFAVPVGATVSLWERYLKDEPREMIGATLRTLRSVTLEKHRPSPMESFWMLDTREAVELLHLTALIAVSETEEPMVIIGLHRDFDTLQTASPDRGDDSPELS